MGLCSILLVREPAERKGPMGLAKPVERRCGFLVRGAGPMPAFLGEESCQGPQRREDMRRVGIADLTAVLVVRAIPDIVIARFDGPMSTHDTQEQLSVFFRVRQCRDAGNRRNRFLALDPGREIREVTVDEGNLCRTAETQFFRVDRQCP